MPKKNHIYNFYQVKTLLQLKNVFRLEVKKDYQLSWTIIYTNALGGYPTIRFQQQAIIPTYELVCCGNITEWGVDVHPVTGTVPVVYSLDFQIWRSSPTADDSTGTGCYVQSGGEQQVHLYSYKYTNFSIKSLT
jgi:hypothetical protein